MISLNKESNVFQNPKNFKVNVSPKFHNFKVNVLIIDLPAQNIENARTIVREYRSWKLSPGYKVLGLEEEEKE